MDGHLFRSYFDELGLQLLDVLGLGVNEFPPRLYAIERKECLVVWLRHRFFAHVLLREIW